LAKISLGNKMRRNTKEGTANFILPSIRKLDASDCGQDVNTQRRNSNLVGAPNFLSAPITRMQFGSELCI
jgi:hypothetical protein